MQFLKTVYKELAKRNVLETDKIWFNHGFYFDVSLGKNVDDFEEIAFSDLPKEYLDLRVSANQYESGTKFYWIEGNQLCVGKDGNVVPRLKK